MEQLMTDDMGRTCPKCHEHRPLTAYARSSRDGVQHWCRTCMTAARRAWRAGLRDQPVSLAFHRARDAMRKRQEYRRRRARTTGQT